MNHSAGCLRPPCRRAVRTARISAATALLGRDAGCRVSVSIAPSMRRRSLSVSRPSEPCTRPPLHAPPGSATCPDVRQSLAGSVWSPRRRRTSTLAIPIPYYHTPFAAGIRIRIRLVPEATRNRDRDPRLQSSRSFDGSRTPDRGSADLHFALRCPRERGELP